MSYQARVADKELYETASAMGRPWLMRSETGELLAYSEWHDSTKAIVNEQAFSFGGYFVLQGFKRTAGMINANDMLEYIEVIENHKKTRREVLVERWGGMTSNDMADFLAGLSSDGGGLYSYKKNAFEWAFAHSRTEAMYGWAVYLDGYPRKDEFE